MIKLAILLKRRKGMNHQEFLDYRRDIHAPLLLSIPETKSMSGSSLYPLPFSQQVTWISPLMPWLKHGLAVLKI